MVSFKIAIYVPYLKLGVTGGRPGRKSNVPGPSTEVADVIYDAKPVTYCVKGNITLCTDCFAP